MGSHQKVVQAVKEYFRNISLPQRNKEIKEEEPIRFGTQSGGLADVVLLSNSRFVAIAECKNPWNDVESAKAQLKSYLCATGTQFGVLAIGRNSKNWMFCENKGNYYFTEILEESDFLAKIDAWTPNNNFQYLEETARQWENTANEQKKSIHKWQLITVGLSIAFFISIVFLLTLLGNQSSTPPITFSGMSIIHAGEFQMGSNDPEAEDDEQPVHIVYLDAFYIDQYEVTNAQYKQFIDANPLWQKEHIPSQYHDGDYLKHWKGNNYPEGKESHPVVYISWYAAMAYADWVGKRLPTEAEWEKAARGGLIDQAYPWGNSIDSSKANYSGEIGDTTPIGSYPPNAYGLYDMAGNAWEWCLDLYQTDFYTQAPLQNPIAGESLIDITKTFLTVKNPRVLRSGYWNNPPAFIRTADRYKRYPGSAHRGSGFRCVVNLTD